MSKDEEEYPRWKRWLIVAIIVMVVIATVLVDLLVFKGAWWS